MEQSCLSIMQVWSLTISEGLPSVPSEYISSDVARQHMMPGPMP